MENLPELIDITMCCLCKETLEDPITFPCIHTFCMKCILNCRTSPEDKDDSTFLCPDCAEPYVVTKDGIAAMPRNAFIEKLIKLKTMMNPDLKRSCNGCTVEPIYEVSSLQMYCIACSQILCSDCVKNHKLKKATKHHEILDLMEGNIDLPKLMESLGENYCREHKDMRLDLVCTDCRVQLCLNCYIGCHQQHKLQGLGEHTKEFRTQLMSFVNTMESFEDEMKHRRKQLTSEQLELILEVETLENDIKIAEEEIAKMVGNQANMLISKTQSDKTILSVEIDEIQNTYSLRLNELSVLKAYCKEIAFKGASTDIFRSIDDLKARTETLVALSESALEHSSNPFRLNIHLERVEFEKGFNILGRLQDTVSKNYTYESKETGMKRLSNQIDHLEQELRKEKCLTESLLEKLNENTLNVEQLEFQLCQEKNQRALVEVRNADLKDTSKRESRDWRRKENTMTMQLESVKLMLRQSEDFNDYLECQLKKEKKKVEDLQIDVENLKKMCYKFESKENNMLALRQEEASNFIRKINELQADVDFYKKPPCDWKTSEAKRVFEYSQRPGQFAIRSVEGGCVCGLAILENELFIVSSDSSTVEVWNLETTHFKRRWKLQGMENPIDMIQSPSDNCLYILNTRRVCIDSSRIPQLQVEILRTNTNGNLILSWSVRASHGNMSTSDEGSVVLASTCSNEIAEYSKEGNLLMDIRLLWEYGIDHLHHAVKISTDHFLICHGAGEDRLHRLCIVDRWGAVLKSYGPDWNRRELDCPAYLTKDSAGNFLVVDKLNNRVIVVDSNLKTITSTIGSNSHRQLTTKETQSYLVCPEKICLDEQRSRLFVIENVSVKNIHGHERKLQLLSALEF